METRGIVAILAVLSIGIVAYAIWGQSGHPVGVAVQSAVPTLTVANLSTVRPIDSITLDQHAPELPPVPGREEFVSHCIICHSPRYVMNQPRFPRKVWASEVHKMVTAYGAPIAPDNEKPITDYLVNWHGIEDGKAAIPAPAPVPK
ncbi:MAG: hypothetical protein NVS1B11_24610 [Terriglobales bacterium]